MSGMLVRGLLRFAVATAALIGGAACSPPSSSPEQATATTDQPGESLVAVEESPSEIEALKNRLSLAGTNSKEAPPSDRAQPFGDSSKPRNADTYRSQEESIFLYDWEYNGKCLAGPLRSCEKEETVRVPFPNDMALCDVRFQITRRDGNANVDVRAFDKKYVKIKYWAYGNPLNPQDAAVEFGMKLYAYPEKLTKAEEIQNLSCLNYATPHFMAVCVDPSEKNPQAVKKCYEGSGRCDLAFPNKIKLSKCVLNQQEANDLFNGDPSCTTFAGANPHHVSVPNSPQCQ